MRSKRKSAPSSDEALELARKRWSQLGRLEPSAGKRKKKLTDFLRRKGVSYDETSMVVDRIIEEEENEAEEAEVEVEVEEGDSSGAFDEALGLAQNRWRTLSRLESNVKKRKTKLKNFLMRRGIDFDTVRLVLDDESLAA